MNRTPQTQGQGQCPFCGRYVRRERDGMARHYELTCAALKAMVARVAGREEARTA